MRAGPSFTQISTARSWQSPAPARERVLDVRLERVAAPRTAAMPPCAYFVFDSSALRFVTTRTSPCAAASSANDKPGDAAADDEVVRA